MTDDGKTGPAKSGDAMTGDAFDELLAEVTALSHAEAFRLYARLVAIDPARAGVVALAIRDKARLGQLPEDSIPTLEACLREAPNPRCVVHLAKALAAFGRRAGSASSVLAHRIQELFVLDDPGFWVLDGSLWAIGYLGGDAARALVGALAAERPSRVARSDSVYQGRIGKAEREARYAETLAGVRELIEAADPGVWREKKTALKGRRGARAAKKPRLR